MSNSDPDRFADEVNELLKKGFRPQYGTFKVTSVNQLLFYAIIMTKR